MCKSGWEFWRNARPIAITTVTAAGAFERFVIGRNPERIAMILATSGTIVAGRPILPAGLSNVFSWNPNTTYPYLRLRIDDFGQLMFEGWEFFITSIGGTVSVIELATPADSK